MLRKMQSMALTCTLKMCFLITVRGWGTMAGAKTPNLPATVCSLWGRCSTLLKHTLHLRHVNMFCVIGLLRWSYLENVNFEVIPYPHKRASSHNFFFQNNFSVIQEIDRDLEKSSLSRGNIEMTDMGRDRWVDFGDILLLWGTSRHLNKQNPRHFPFLKMYTGSSNGSFHRTNLKSCFLSKS